MKSIRIFDKDINLLGEIDSYEEFKFKRRFFGLSEFELKINSSKLHVDKLVKNNLILLGKDYNKVGIVLHREQSGDKRSDILTIKGVSLEGLINRRLIVPDIGVDFESCNGKQETIIKHFIDKNCVTPAISKRIIPRLVIAEDKLRGVDDGWRSSYENLSDKVKEICEYSGLGWNVILDKDSNNFIFDVIEGKNLTYGQRINPPVIFRNDFNNIGNRKYLESIINYKNVTYVGTAEDSTKLVLSVGESEGFERIETFSSANSDDALEITKEGKVLLKELEELKSFEIDVNPTKTFIYEKDYDLGDIVTVQDRGLGLTMDSRIIEIEETYTIKNGMSLKVTFGNSIPNILTKIKRLEKKVR